MDAVTGTVDRDGSKGSPGGCQSDFQLEQVQAGDLDKLGNMVLEVLWCGTDYRIYRTEKGVFVNFSDCAHREKDQRIAFTEICPELCELRFLTHEMRSAGHRWWGRRPRDDESGGTDLSNAGSLFDHNIAQALMLLMEGRRDEAKSIAKAALDMAVKRSTNDNTIRYVSASMVAALAACAIIGPLGYVAYLQYPNEPYYCYFVAGVFGVLGAAFSVAIRVQSFQAKPCQQSNMNYLMARLRIGIGLVSALVLYLVVVRGNFVNMPGGVQGADGAAIVGFLGGFAERLVPTVFRRAAEAFEESSGTPVQLARMRPAPPPGQATSPA